MYKRQVFICAFLFAVHILVIDYFTQYVDGVKMSCIQFFVCGAVSGAAMLLFEEPSVSALLSAWQPVLYAGVLSSGAGYTLQIIGQKGMNPTVASLILSLESVVSVLAGLLLLGETLSGREAVSYTHLEFYYDKAETDKDSECRCMELLAFYFYSNDCVLYFA